MQGASWWTCLKQEVQTPLRECYIVAGADCAVSTNSEDILAAARNSFRHVTDPRPSPTLTVSLWVDSAAETGPPWPQPRFRGLSHLVHIGFDRQNSLLLDTQRRRIIGRFSPAMARDRSYWQRVIFPTAFGLISESLGITTLHCACVERGGSGLLLAGESGAGKSTLSLALARSGFAFLSDDWTYFSQSDRRTLAWGLITPVKLLPDAAEHFPELRKLEPGISLNGERAYEVDPEQVFGVQRALWCEPRWLIFLERQRKPGHEFVSITPHETAARLEFDLEDLPPEMSQVRESQRETIRALGERECWLLRHGENPQTIAQTLTQFCADSEIR